MRKSLIGLALGLAMAAPAGHAALAQGGAAAEAEAPVVREARAFMAAYARELAAGDRAGIAARYDRRGSWVMGGGAKRYSDHAQTVTYYAGPNWSPPAAFEWRDLSYEPLGPDAVAVVGTFLWTRAAGQPPITVAYTGVLVRQDGSLRIRIEDEDAAPQPSRP